MSQVQSAFFPRVERDGVQYVKVYGCDGEKDIPAPQFEENVRKSMQEYEDWKKLQQEKWKKESLEAKARPRTEEKAEEGCKRAF